MSASASVFGGKAFSRVDTSQFLSSLRRFAKATDTEIRFVFRWQAVLLAKDIMKRIMANPGISLQSQKRAQQSAIEMDLRKLFVPVSNNVKSRQVGENVILTGGSPDIDPFISNSDNGYKIPARLWGNTDLASTHRQARNKRGRVRGRSKVGSIGRLKFVDADHVKISEFRKHRAKMFQRIGRAKAAFMGSANFFNSKINGSVKNIAPSWISRHKMSGAIHEEKGSVEDGSYMVAIGTTLWWIRDNGVVQESVNRRVRDLMGAASKRLVRAKEKAGFK